MVTLTNPESDLVIQLLDALEEAITAVPAVDITYANKTKIQKMIYFAVDEYDIPVTYSWYLAGAVVPDRSIGPGALESAPSGPNDPSDPSQSSDASTDADPDSHDASTDEPTVDPILFTGSQDTETDSGSAPEADPSAYINRDELISFYRSVLPDVWNEQTMRFLQNFYHEKAPERYRLLYIESTHLRTHLAELAEVIEQHLDGKPTNRSVEELKESIELSISDLHYYLRQDDQLRQTFELVVDGTGLIEDALLSLSRLDADALTETHLEAVKELKEFFFYYVWKYPCLLISQRTATGPQAAELSAERAAEFEAFEEAIADRRGELVAELSAADLLPGPSDYPPIEDPQVAETLSDLSAEYLE